MERGLCLILTAPAHAADFSGLVVSVLDGDTIEVLHNRHHERIRLSGIDCPEKGQAYGQRVKQAASALVFGRDVILQTHGSTPGDTELERLEKEAREAKKGLWADPQPMPPWVYRNTRPRVPMMNTY